MIRRVVASSLPLLDRRVAPPNPNFQEQFCWCESKVTPS